MGAKLANKMKKLLLSFLLLPGLLLSGCSNSNNEPEEEPNYLSTTVRASAFFSEVGSIEQLNSVYVGRTYSVNFAPFCLSDTELMKIINGSVEKVTYYLNTPNVGNEVIGVSTAQPFTISYSPKKSGQCTLSVSFDLSSKDHNKWVEVESIVEVIGAE